MEEEPLSIRREKLERLRQKGIEPYDGSYPITHIARSIRENFADLEGKEVRLAGRIMSLRVHGKATFAHIDDGDSRIQVYFRYDVLGEESYQILTKLLDIGDIIGFKGTVFKTKTGEPTVACNEYKILSKALRDLPEKWHGLQDVELRYRQRYLDFISNPHAKEIVKLRARVLSLTRSYLDANGYLEVETPILHPVAGGALARPFVTFHNALGINLYLRIAPELYLKRLTIGGFNRVYELGRYFRNEGISSTHNPEFTALEFYQAYADYHDTMALTEALISYIVKEIFGSLNVSLRGVDLDFTLPWPRITLREAFQTYAGVSIDALKEESTRMHWIEERGLTIEKKPSWANVIDETLKKIIEPQINGPLFLYDYPKVLSPLARSKAEDPEWVERFQPIILSLEMGNGYSELADPLEQRARFEQQLREREEGEEDAHPMDEDFVEALEYGMPPTSGVGVGIDRLLMLLANEDSLREVITFPTLRPK